MKCQFCQKEVDFDEGRHMSISGFRWDEHQKCVPRLRKPKESQTPLCDEAQIKARVGHQAMGDKDWPWFAINEGWDFARQLELECAALRKALEGLVHHFCTKSAELSIGERYPVYMTHEQREAYEAARTALGKGNPYP